MKSKSFVAKVLEMMTKSIVQEKANAELAAVQETKGYKLRAFALYEGIYIK